MRNSENPKEITPTDKEYALFRHVYYIAIWKLSWNKVDGYHVHACIFMTWSIYI